MDGVCRQGLVDIMGKNLENSSLIHYYIKEQGIPVSSATLFIHKKAASIYNCGTIDAARKKGYMSALITHIINTAIDRKCTDLILQASPSSTPIFEKFGCTACLSYNVYVNEGAPA